MAARRWLFLFTEGDPHRRDLLSGKGAGLAEMTQAGLDYVSASSYRIPVARLAAAHTELGLRDIARSSAI